MTSILLSSGLRPLINIRHWAQRRSGVAKLRVIDRLSPLFAEDPILKVQEFQGEFAMGAYSDLFRRVATEGTYEPELVDVCLKHMDRDRDVVDVGANIGFYTVLFAKTLRRGRVLAVEPTVNALSRLRENIRRNNVQENVIVFEGAVTSRSGLTNVRSVVGKEEYSTVVEPAHRCFVGPQTVQRNVVARTLDELVEQFSLRPGFVKVDVEGAESLVFEGASHVLHQHRPIVLTELSEVLLAKNGTSARAVVNLIAKAGYRVIDPLDPTTVPGSKKFGEILCLPEEWQPS